LVGPDSERVRECANNRCLWLFLDDSKNGTRRWCSMQACGNRAKAYRHYLRQKEK
jgi:predicted RNA-binding Zn ribbon-like protein